jgi:hypothetical protein
MKYFIVKQGHEGRCEVAKAKNYESLVYEMQVVVLQVQALHKESYSVSHTTEYESILNYHAWIQAHWKKTFAVGQSLSIDSDLFMSYDESLKCVVFNTPTIEEVFEQVK